MIDDLKLLCENWLISKITPENVSNIHFFAQILKLKKTKVQVKKYIKKYFIYYKKCYIFNNNTHFQKFHC